MKNVHLAGIVRIRGRTCDVVEGTVDYRNRGLSAKVSYAVDRETGLVLRGHVDGSDASTGAKVQVRDLQSVMGVRQTDTRLCV